MKYSEKVLEYKNTFKSVQEALEKTDSEFSDKYFSGGSGVKRFYYPFVPGEIYSFTYTSESKFTKEKKFINRNPIIICIGSFNSSKGDVIVNGIDLITVPPEYRIKILEKIHDNFLDKIENNQKNGIPSALPLTSKNLNLLLSGTGYDNSIFGFRLDSMKEINTLNLDDWYKIPYLKKSSVEGLSINLIYNEYQSKLK